MFPRSDELKKVPSDDVANPDPPEVLYKYLPPDRISLLENMEVHFSRPSQFNDTFDTHYLVPISKGSGAKAYRLLLRNRLGILCLTERSNDHLMWVHYAQNHTGFVLGFDARAPFFREKARVLRQVVYQRGPRVFAEADLNVCFYKSDVWKHEREWRCVRQFDSSESRVVAIGPSLITHVILGAKMEEWQVARIVLWATAHEMMAHTKFLISTPANNSWTFENKPRTMAICEHCGGAGYLTDGPKH
jgi:Protein of unknown function (DUF2971)